MLSEWEEIAVSTAPGQEYRDVDEIKLFPTSNTQSQNPQTCMSPWPLSCLKPTPSHLSLITHKNKTKTTHINSQWEDQISQSSDCTQMATGGALCWEMNLCIDLNSHHPHNHNLPLWLDSKYGWAIVHHFMTFTTLHMPTWMTIAGYVSLVDQLRRKY